MIYIRADANPNIGMGHIMRCLSIADAASTFDKRIVFILADNIVQSLVESRGYKTVILASDYQKMEEELELWEDNRLEVPNYIIIDSYYATLEYLGSLKKILKKHNGKEEGKVVYIDDLALYPYPVDVLVNYNVYANFTAYEQLYSSIDINKPTLILGQMYAPLRADFRGVSKHCQAKKAHHILISTGGSDEFHLALQLTRRLAEKGINKYVYHFLIGSLNADRDEIEKSTQNLDFIVIHENVQNMKGLLEKMDIVVSAAGSTMYEICACGIPLITYALANNQLLGANSFEKLGLAINIGDLRREDSINRNELFGGELRADATEIILNAIDKLNNDYQHRVAMGQTMQKMIDGFGADRMVKAILHI